MTCLEVDALVRSHDGDVAFVVNVSGGKDSTRTLGAVAALFPNNPLYVVMADTGFEHQKPIPAVEWAGSITARFGYKLDVVRNPNKTYLEMVEARGMFPSSQYRQCTSDLKRGPIQKYIRSLPHRTIVNCLGLRAQESSQRSRQPPWQVDTSLTTSTRKVFTWLPIFEETLDDVLRWHWEMDIPLHPVYVPRYHRNGEGDGYLHRFSCRLCIFSTDTEIRAIYERDRDAFDAIATLEQKTGFTMKSSGSLFSILNNSIPASFQGRLF